MRMLIPNWTRRGLSSDLSTDLFDEVDRFFEDFQKSAPLRYYDERAFQPACEVIEADKHFLMSVDLPGLRKEDIKIEITDNLLTISGERKKESSADSSNQKVQRYERSYGFFKRSFTLPSTVDTSKVEARYENGVLELYVPKAESAQPRQIEIQSGEGAKSGFFNKWLNSKNNE